MYTAGLALLGNAFICVAWTVLHSIYGHVKWTLPNIAFEAKILGLHDANLRNIHRFPWEGILHMWVVHFKIFKNWEERKTILHRYSITYLRIHQHFFWSAFIFFVYFENLRFSYYDYFRNILKSKHNEKKSNRIKFREVQLGFEWTNHTLTHLKCIRLFPCVQVTLVLTHFRPVMPLGNRKKMMIFSVQYYNNLKNIKSEIQLYRHFPKLKIAYF